MRARCLVFPRTSGRHSPFPVAVLGQLQGRPPAHYRVRTRMQHSSLHSNRGHDLPALQQRP